jgi:Holliday junction resolvase RusA-like endonuclease
VKKFSFHQVFNIRPRAKGRPRLTKTGHTYTPKQTVDYEKAIREAYTGPCFEDGMLSVKLRFTMSGTEIMIEKVGLNPNVDQPNSRLRGDIDNYAKSVLDALNGVAYKDDRQIVCLYLEKA